MSNYVKTKNVKKASTFIPKRRASLAPHTP